MTRKGETPRDALEPRPVKFCELHRNPPVIQVIVPRIEHPASAFLGGQEAMEPLHRHDIETWKEIKEAWWPLLNLVGEGADRKRDGDVRFCAEINKKQSRA